MEPENKNCALVTGASLGIGRSIAKELASRGYDLILNSLPGQSLPDLCQELESEYKIRAYCVEGDLTTENGPEKLFEFVQGNKLGLNILVNNAGIGYEGPVEVYSKKQIDHMILLNVRATTLLTVLFTPELKTHNRSYILNISSFGGYLPTAYKSIYLATKSYVFYFTRALESELRGSTVKTCVATPSAVRTNVNTLDRIERHGWFSQKSALNPEEVAAEVLTGMFKGKKVIVPGRLSKMFFCAGLFVPEGIMLWLTRRIFRNYRQ
ncbi:MAG: SDR family NAD(P)-dependent oxidoreductase [Bacteroidia bacterium]|nr:MAG: SDR family NAD(P)-dependent oxidoreductase [Bacteroidia bacterium]